MGKKKAHESHGGAWKVAYADFVTAMMALFMVLWIVSQDQKVVKATADYFKNPFQPIYQKDSGVIKKDVSSKNSGNGAQDKHEKKIDSAPTPVDMAFLQALANELYASLKLDATSPKNPLDIIVTQDGLRILLYSREDQPLFEQDTSRLTTWGDFVMHNLAWIMMRYEMRVRIDAFVGAHTVPLSASPDYGTWELASDRANVSQRSLVHYGLEKSRLQSIMSHVVSDLVNKSKDKQHCERLEMSLNIATNQKK